MVVDLNRVFTKESLCQLHLSQFNGYFIFLTLFALQFLSFVPSTQTLLRDAPSWNDNSRTK
jgi:hypothetical protein